jgi:hypothetical protein
MADDLAVSKEIRLAELQKESDDKLKESYEHLIDWSLAISVGTLLWFWDSFDTFPFGRCLVEDKCTGVPYGHWFLAAIICFTITTAFFGYVRAKLYYDEYKLNVPEDTKLRYDAAMLNRTKYPDQYLTWTQDILRKRNANRLTSLFYKKSAILIFMIIYLIGIGFVIYCIYLYLYEPITPPLNP